jgi:hypothetical protein
MSPATLVTWLAHRVYEVPAQFVAAFYAYGSPATVRAICWRVQQRISDDVKFKDALERVTASPTHKW